MRRASLIIVLIGMIVCNDIKETHYFIQLPHFRKLFASCQAFTTIDGINNSVCSGGLTNTNINYAIHICKSTILWRYVRWRYLVTIESEVPSQKLKQTGHKSPYKMAISVTECDRSSQNLLIILFTPHIYWKLTELCMVRVPKELRSLRKGTANFGRCKIMWLVLN